MEYVTQFITICLGIYFSKFQILYELLSEIFANVLGLVKELKLKIVLGCAVMQIITRICINYRFFFSLGYKGAELEQLLKLLSAPFFAYSLK